MWPFNRKDRKLAKQMMDRLERQDPEVHKLAKDLKAHIRSNKFRDDFRRALHPRES